MLNSKKLRKKRLRKLQKSPKLKYKKLEDKIRPQLNLLEQSLKRKKKRFRDRILLPKRQRFWMLRQLTRLLR